jgi:hypothetical protein
VVNWAFTLLMAAAEATQPYRGPGPCSSKAASAGCIHDAKPLVALTGLVRVLWHCVHVDGLPVELRGVLLVAMALRNLLLVVALPVWARKAVAAQLRAWQQGISEAQACNPARPHGRVKFVHLLRIFHEVSGRGRGQSMAPRHVCNGSCHCLQRVRSSVCQASTDVAVTGCIHQMPRSNLVLQPLCILLARSMFS